MKRTFICLIVLLTCLNLFAQSNNKFFKDRFAVGFEDGLAFKYRIADKKSGIMGGLFYHIHIPKNDLKTEEIEAKVLHDFNMRLEIYRDIIILPRVRTSFYIGSSQGMKNEEEIEDSIPFSRRIQIWNTDIRTGAIVTLYCAKNFMVSWRIGMEYSFYYGYNFNDYKELSIFKKDGETIFNNLGLYIFF